jgi:CheY-like chemotaxis protein
LVTGKPPSLLRELAHELRDALSPVRAALDLMRVRAFAPEVSRAMAPRIEQGLDRALAILDVFVLAEQCESGAAELSPRPMPLARLLELALEEIAAPRRARCRVQRPVADIDVMADVGRAVQVLTAMLQHALAAGASNEPVEVHTVSSSEAAEVRLAFAPAQPPGDDWFESYRVPSGVGVTPLRTARCLMRLQQGSLTLRALPSARAELVAGFLRPAAAAATAAATAGAAGAAAAVAAGTAADRAHPAPRGDRGSAAGAAAGMITEVPAGVAAGRGAAAGTRLLMVEDNTEVRRAYREALAAMGYEVSEARNAEEALSAVATLRPAVALIDINLPDLNGYRLAQRLRATAAEGIRLVMMSGVTLDEVTLQLSRQAGFDQCFDKAAGPKALHALLTRLL